MRSTTLRRRTRRFAGGVQHRLVQTDELVLSKLENVGFGGSNASIDVSFMLRKERLQIHLEEPC